MFVLLMLFCRVKILVCWPLFCGCTWVYVGGSTHWVGLRSAMTHPPSSEAWWNSTHKHTGLNTSCRLSFSTELKYADLVNVTVVSLLSDLLADAEISDIPLLTISQCMAIWTNKREAWIRLVNVTVSRTKHVYLWSWKKNKKHLATSISPKP